MKIPVIKLSREQMRAGIARFSSLQGCDTGLPDMYLPDGLRTFYSVLGFEQPSIEGANSPFGATSRPHITGMKPGFGLSYITCKPGCGALMHAHDTNETFVVMSGAWEMSWEDEDGVASEVLRPRDVCSFPVGVQRQFMCVEAAPGEADALLLAVIAGDAPGAEYSPEVIDRMADAGLIDRANYL